MSDGEAVMIYLEQLELFEVKGYKLGLNKAIELFFDAKGNRNLLLKLIDREMKRADKKLTDIDTCRLAGSIDRYLRFCYTEEWIEKITS